MRVLFCSSEVSPFAKTGGLADVTGSLPASLQKLGCDVRIFMPLYRSVRNLNESLELLVEDIVVPVGIHDFHAHIWEGRTATGVPIYFLEKDEFYDRSFLYGSPVRGDYEDNAERFIAFSRAAQRLCLALNWFPSIFHLHDWQTGPVAPYFQLNWRYHPNLLGSGTVFTIHNIAYQGLFPSGHFSLMQLPPSVFSMQGIEFWGQCSFLKAGIVYSDFVTTVSPRYSREIQTEAFSFGLEGLLREREDSLEGILNGIDTDEWDPESDPLIPANFSAADLSGKAACKKALCAHIGLTPDSCGPPLIGMIGRLATQKGFDLLGEILPNLMRLDVNVVILGTGDAAIEERLQQMERLFPSRLKLLLQFDEQLAHLIEAGSDIFLMPSRYEPCGLNQMYSLRYATIPVVHATGGLDDSVSDVLKEDAGTGFKFYEYTPEAFLEAVKSALDLFTQKEKWIEVQKRAMSQDFSWDRSAREYVRIYEKVLSRKKKIPGRILGAGEAK
jgi:starch synthase